MKYAVKRKYYRVDTRICPYGSEFYVEYDNMGVFDSEIQAFKHIIDTIKSEIDEQFDYIKALPDQEDLDMYFNDLYYFSFGQINCKNIEYYKS